MTLLYIDPGTGSMIFSLALGIFSVVWFGAKKLFMKLKYLSPRKTKGDKRKREIVIYGEDKRYWTTFKGILDELEHRQVGVTYLAGSADDPILKEHYDYVETEVIGLGNKAYARLNFLNAHVVMATTPGLDVYQWKRSKTVDWYVHLTHMVGDALDYRMFGTAFFDALLYCSDAYTPTHRELEASRGMKPKEIIAVGCPYMDYLLKRNLSEKDDKAESETVHILVAPTWGTNSLFHQFGDELMDVLASSGYDITFRPHPQSYISDSALMGRLQAKYAESEHIHWNRDTDNFGALMQADILISDYSGIIYDFAFIFERPVIYSATQELNLSETDYAFIHHSHWSQDVLPQIGRELSKSNIASIGSVIAELLHSPQSRESIRKTRDEYWHNRGHAAEAVVNYLINKCKEIEEKQ